MLEYLTTWNTHALNYMIFTIGGVLQSCVICVLLCKHENHEMAFGHVMGFIIFHVCCIPGVLFFQSCITTYSDNIKVSQLNNMTCSQSQLNWLSLQITISDATQSAKIFMTIFILISFISVLMTNFQLRKSHAYIHVTLYIVMNTFIMCSEKDQIHPFGSSHNILKLRLKEANFAWFCFRIKTFFPLWFVSLLIFKNTED